MRAPSFDSLARDLRAAGAAPFIITRTVQELRDHCADAEAAALERGLNPAQARHAALESVGSFEAIVAAVAARSELLDWRQRWPQSAYCVDSVAWYLAVPAAPFVYCATHPSWLLRWVLSSGLAVCVTASILLSLHWLIV
jgi:hypothetical protein